MYNSSFVPKIDLEHLGDLLKYFIAQRELGKPVTKMHRTVGDLRTTVQKIVAHHFSNVSEENEDLFFLEITDHLEDIREELLDEGLDIEYCDYCIDRLILSFKEAALGEPVLVPFDFNLKPFIRLVKSDRTSNLTTTHI